jgi:hypothetical protein
MSPSDFITTPEDPPEAVRIARLADPSKLSEDARHAFETRLGIFADAGKPTVAQVVIAWHEAAGYDYRRKRAEQS